MQMRAQVPIHSQIQPPTEAKSGTQQKMAQVLGPGHPCVRLRLSSGLLASVCQAALAIAECILRANPQQMHNLSVSVYLPVLFLLSKTQLHLGN